MNQSSWQRKNDFVVELFKSEQDIAISERIFSLILNNESRTTKVNLRTREERTREILIAVDEKSSKIDKNWTIVQEGINLSLNYTFFNHNSIFLCLQFASHCFH